MKNFALMTRNEVIGILMAMIGYLATEASSAPRNTRIQNAYKKICDLTK